MNSNKITYNKAVKKQITTLIILIGLLIGILILFPPVDQKGAIMFLFYGLAIFFAGYTSFKNQAKEARCPHCDVDLFEIIGASKMAKMEFNYCPNCGKNVEV